MKSSEYIISVLMIFLFASYLSAQETSAPAIGKSGQTGLVYTESAKTLNTGRLVIGFYGNGTLDNSVIKNVLVDSTNLTPKSYQYNLTPFIGYGILNFLDISALLPIYFDNVSTYYVGIKQVGGLDAGIGDCAIKLKLQLPPQIKPRVLDIAYSLGIDLPTGNTKAGFFPRQSYYTLKDSVQAFAGYDSLAMYPGFYSSGSPEINIKMLLTLNGWESSEYTPLMFHLNYGIKIPMDQDLDQVFFAGAALEYHPAKAVGLFAEVSMEPRLKKLVSGDIMHDPFRITPGITITPASGFIMTLSGTINLTSSRTTSYLVNDEIFTARPLPRWQLNMSVGWAGFAIKMDSDHDGIIDRSDKCPTSPEDVDGFQDNDGCPDYDNDNDGIPDSIDKCPNAPEDKDNFEDADGCPDFDNDKDSVPDSLDKCPNEKEDHDGFWDSDGCPDYDNDNDGIPDSLDKCPTIPEDKDGFQDFDGCPDPDNDLDGIMDSVDKCPNLAGTVEFNGCPPPASSQAVVPSISIIQHSPHAAKQITRGVHVLKGILFKDATADLVQTSYITIDMLYEAMKAYPFLKIELDGYTDKATTLQGNKALAQRRAESIRAYLILKGIAPTRITAIGKGQVTVPFDPANPQASASCRIEMQRTD